MNETLCFNHKIALTAITVYLYSICDVIYQFYRSCFVGFFYGNIHMFFLGVDGMVACDLTLENEERLPYSLYL